MLKCASEHFPCVVFHFHGMIWTKNKQVISMKRKLFHRILQVNNISKLTEVKQQIPSIKKSDPIFFLTQTYIK